MLPGIVECAAFAVRSEIADTEEEVMVAVVVDGDDPPDVAVLFAELCATMPRHAVRYLRVVAELPKTPTQRVQKFKLLPKASPPTPTTARRSASTRRAIDRTIWAARAPFPDLGGSQRGFCYRTPPRSTKVAATVRIS